MSTPNISAITVLVEVDGRLCLAPIRADAALMFVGMLPAFQPGEPKTAKLYAMPPAVIEKAKAVGEALAAHLAALRPDRAAQPQEPKP